MFKLLLPLLLVTSLYAEDDYREGTLFRVIPESQAHTFSGVARDRDFNKDSMKVLVWNIKKTQMDPWEFEFHQYAKGKDLYLIQEAYQNELFNSTLEFFPNVRWDMGISFIYKKDGDIPTGNMIGSKVEPTYVKVRHTTDNEPVVRTPKATTFAKYPIEASDKEMLVISIHGINLTGLDTFVRHLDQIKTEIDKHDGPILFAGDFNTRTKARTEYLMNYVNKLGMKTVAFENGQCRMRFKLTPYFLDHAFVRGLEVKKAAVDCESTGSDHKPLLLELATVK